MCGRKRLLSRRLWYHRISAHIRPRSYYELRKTRRWTSFPPRRKAGPLPAATFCAPLLFTTPTPFLHESHCLPRSPVSSSDERSIRKTRFLSFITYVQRPATPVIERLVRTIVTPWSGITWAYYVGYNCTVDVITTRCLCVPLSAIAFAITATGFLWPSFIFFFFVFF